MGLKWVQLSEIKNKLNQSGYTQGGIVLSLNHSVSIVTLGIQMVLACVVDSDLHGPFDLLM